MVEEMERDLIEMDGWNGRMAERAAEAESFGDRGSYGH